MKRLKPMLMPSLMFLAMLASSSSAVAAVVAIVNKANTVADKKMISKFYSLEAKSWPDGSRAILYETSIESEREEFSMSYTGKSAETLETNLAKAVFVGRSKPHKVLSSDASIIDEVSKDKDAVGYVNESSLNNSVRAVR